MSAARERQRKPACPDDAAATLEGRLWRSGGVGGHQLLLHQRGGGSIEVALASIIGISIRCSLVSGRKSVATALGCLLGRRTVVGLTLMGPGSRPFSYGSILQEAHCSRSRCSVRVICFSIASWLFIRFACVVGLLIWARLGQSRSSVGGWNRIGQLVDIISYRTLLLPAVFRAVGSYPQRTLPAARSMRRLWPSQNASIAKVHVLRLHGQTTTIPPSIPFHQHPAGALPRPQHLPEGFMRNLLPIQGRWKISSGGR